MGDHHSSRRDFLTGKAAVDRVLDWADGPAADGLSAQSTEAAATSPEASLYLIHVSRRAMACEFQLYFNAGQYPDATESALEALDLVDRLEAQLTVYREQSEVIDINRSAAAEPVPVEPGLFALLQTALDLHQKTEGAFDITSGPLSRAWGFFRRAGKMPTEDQLADALASVGSQFIRLDEAERSIQFLRPEIEINLNSIGKGYALDRAADVLETKGIEDFLFHGGQSSVLARGTQAGLEGGWTVGLRHPLRPNLRLAEFRLRDRALATSGTGRQFFHFRGRRYGHILDPRTGQPARDVYSSTVLARSAAIADALATAFYVMGPDASLAYCRQHGDVGMLMTCPGAKQGSLRLVSCGLEEDDVAVFN